MAAFNPKLWQKRSVEETQDLYAGWAGSYDADVEGAGYLTPKRLAEDLAAAMSDQSLPVLDFGCGTGLAGAALKAAGFSTLHGTDISPEMLAEAEAKGLYTKTWQSEPGALDVAPGAYAAIVACGVVSYGAAPPETLDLILDALAPGGLLAFSYNDPTLDDPSYAAAVERALGESADLVSESYGPHLTDKEMQSTIYILRRR